MMYFEKWNSLLTEPSTLRGVKTHSAYKILDETISDLWSLDPKYCVNPYDITTAPEMKNSTLVMAPLKERNGVEGYRVDKVPSTERSNLAETLRVKSELTCKDEYDSRSPLLMQQETIVNSASPGSVIVKSETTSPGLTTDLENFQDLTVWCRRTPKPSKMTELLETDELNTPVIELGEFLFTSPPTLYNTNDDDECYSLLDVSIQHGNNVADLENKFTTTVQEDQQQPIGNESSIITTDTFIINNNDQNEDYQQYSNVYTITDNGDGVIQEQFINNIIETSTDDVNSFNFDSTITLPLQENTAEIVFTNTQPTHGPPVLDLSGLLQADRNSLQLDLNNMWLQPNKNVPAIDTPEVINAALALDKEGFNLINFINNENILVEELPASISSSLPEDDQSQCTSLSMSDSSDDEDYEPPWKQKRKTKSQKSIRKPKPVFNDSDLSNECTASTSTTTTVDDILKPAPRRGRPPKRNISTSSDSNASSITSRYRELRDKNNEASRKSRLNRKMKELTIEEEAKDLDTRNRKLKVRVEELEKVVNTMRSNLMQLLLKK